MNNDETLILGIGNTLLTDEGAGIHALNHLQSAIPNIWPDISPNTTDIPNLNFIDGGTLSFTLAVWIEDCTNLIVFDATELNQEPGTVNVFVGAEMDNFLGTTKRSAHEVGLIDLMDIARLTGHHPENRALIGIQPDKMTWGMKPTAAVQNALDEAIAEAVKLINQWQKVNTGQEAQTTKEYSDNNESMR